MKKTTWRRRRGELDELNRRVHVAEVGGSERSRNRWLILRRAEVFLREEAARKVDGCFLLPSKLETKALVGGYEPWAAESEAALTSHWGGTLAGG